MLREDLGLSLPERPCCREVVGASNFEAEFRAPISNKPAQNVSDNKKDCTSRRPLFKVGGLAGCDHRGAPPRKRQAEIPTLKRGRLEVQPFQLSETFSAGLFEIGARNSASKFEAPPLCSKVALADSVEDPLEASPLCSKVALADSV